MSRRTLFLLGFTAFLCPASLTAQPASEVRITVLDADDTPISGARVCLYNHLIGRQDIVLTTAQGVARFRVDREPGLQVSYVASRDAYRGEAAGPRAVPGGPGLSETVTLQAGASNTAPVCSARPTVTLFTIDDKAATTESERVTLQFRTSASFDEEVSYCASADDGGCDPRRADIWMSPPDTAEASGFEPAFTADHVLPKRLGEQDVYLQVRWAGGPPGPTAQARIERIPRPIALRTFAIDEGAPLTGSPEVSLGWLTEFLAPEAAVEFCAVERGDECQDWRDDHVSLDAVPGIGPRFQADHDLPPSQLPGLLPVRRTVDLRMRYAAYPDIVSAPASDDILLLQGTEIYEIPGADAHDEAQAKGWGFSFNDPLMCTIDSPALGEGDEGFSMGTSNGCAFDLFTGGTLAARWTFEGFEIDDSRSIPEPGECEFAEAIRPTVGDSSLRTLIAVFPSPRPLCPFCPVAPPTFCLRAFETVRLRGPADADWRDAFPGVSP